MAGVVSPYLGAIFGVRRVLLLAILSMFIASLVGPLSPNLHAFLMTQFLSGLGSGTFIPLTISFIVRNLPWTVDRKSTCKSVVQEENHEKAAR